jgi:hypothetical protein
VLIKPQSPVTPSKPRYRFLYEALRSAQRTKRQRERR